MNLEFEDPPKRTAGTSSKLWAEESRALRDNPGRWAKLDTTHLNETSRRGFPWLVNNGRYAAFREGFEAVGSQGETWVRYIGTDQQTPNN